MKKIFLNYNSKYTLLHNSASCMTIFFAVKKDSLFLGLCINQIVHKSNGVFHDEIIKSLDKTVLT